jgi:hypothetical protein
MAVAHLLELDTVGKIADPRPAQLLAVPADFDLAAYRSW